jgi:hypothetical protein
MLHARAALSRQRLSPLAFARAGFAAETGEASVCSSFLNRFVAGLWTVDDGARLAESELQALHGPHYDAPQDGETGHARRRHMSRMRT